MTKPEKPMLAYAVLENDERTGGIIYATSNIAARRQGANEYGDGELSYVTCNRAPWADRYHGKPIPIDLMVLHGWWFECGHCGKRIDEDLLWEKQIEPEDLIGFEHSVSYCDARCEAGAALDKAHREHLQKRWLRRFAKIVKRRFPEAVPVLKHAYASHDGTRYRLQEVTVAFDFPGRQHWPAELTWHRMRSWKDQLRSKPYYQCAGGDREAFEAYADATRATAKEGEPCPPTP